MIGEVKNYILKIGHVKGLPQDPKTFTKLFYGNMNLHVQLDIRINDCDYYCANYFVKKFPSGLGKIGTVSTVISDPDLDPTRTKSSGSGSTKLNCFGG